MDSPIIILGAAGMLGQDLKSLLEREGRSFQAFSKTELDITSLADLDSVFHNTRPKFVINCAAFTNVDACETEVQKAFLINSIGATNVAIAAKRANAHLVHISTDYVFDGTKGTPYSEDDKINPLGIYGKSKAQGELNIIETGCRFSIIRTQWLFGVHGKNFVETMLDLMEKQTRLTIVHDQVGSPTYTGDLATALLRVIDLGLEGIFHVTNSGVASWWSFAKAIAEKKAVTEVQIDPIPSCELKRPAPRPLYSVLDNTKFKQLAGMNLRHWSDALDSYLALRDNTG
jgi:dTDP-4-dehydrorhamnose reductase